MDVNVIEGWKECRACGEYRPLTDFCVNNSSPDGKTSLCRSCVSEYQRQKREFGSAYPEKKLFKKMVRRLVFQKNGCISWLGCCTSDGYPVVYDGHKSVMVSRLLYEWLIGPVPPRTRLGHVCLNFQCVNPFHTGFAAR